MKKMKYLVIPLAAMTLSIQSCHKFYKDSGDLIVEERALEESYDKISVEGSMDVYIVDDLSYDIKVEAGENKMRFIETTVVNHELIIRESSNHVLDDKQTKVYITNQVLDAIDLHGSGDVSGEIIADDINIDMHGSGDVDLDLGEADLVDLDVFGSGDSHLEGSATGFSIRLEGSGDINARYLVAEDVYVHLDGSGDARVYATDFLQVDINGSGDVYYWGDPEVVEVDIDGSGDVYPQ
jgi:hypothetical protein